MLKSCTRCGRIHDFNKQCPKRTIHKNTEASKFRATSRWKKKSLSIRERDKFLCRCCLADIFEAPKQFTFSNLEVHHIIPLEKDISKRLDDDNLITLCSYHHKLAEDGTIPAKILQMLTKEDCNFGEIRQLADTHNTPQPCNLKEKKSSATNHSPK